MVQEGGDDFVIRAALIQICQTQTQTKKTRNYDEKTNNRLDSDISFQLEQKRNKKNSTDHEQRPETGDGRGPLQIHGLIQNTRKPRFRDGSDVIVFLGNSGELEIQ